MRSDDVQKQEVQPEDDPKITNETLAYVRTHAMRCPACTGIPAISYGKGLFGEPDPVYRLECACLDGLISYGDTVDYVIETWNRCIPTAHQKGVPGRPTASDLYLSDRAREQRTERLLREILNQLTCPAHLSHGLKGPCDCEEKTILHPTGAFIAKETWCPKHGYDNDCYQCNPRMFGTELCIKHGTHGAQS